MPKNRPAHVFALSCLAVAQPLFDLLGKNPEFFIARGAGALDVVALVVFAMGIPPLLLVFVAEIAGKARGAEVRERVYQGLMAVLVALVLLLSFRRIPWLPGAASLAAALLLGAAFVVLQARYRAVREFLTLLAVLALVPPVLFLGFSPVRDLLRPGGDEGLAPPARAGRDVPVVLAVFDELPTSSLLDAERNVDPALFPHFAALQRSSTWYRNATTVATLTLTALPAILTGRYPRDHLQATAGDHPANLFTLLPESYGFTVLEPRTELCPPRRCREPRPPLGGRLAALGADAGLVYLHLVLPREVAGRLPGVTTHWDFARVTDKAGDFRRLVERIEASSDPSLVFVHAELPHHPWIYLPSGRRYHPGGELYVDGLEVEYGAASPRWVEDNWAVIQAYQRHLLQLRFTDLLLGELVARLQGQGLWDEAVVVVTADHGISFRRGEAFRTVNERNYADIMSVPLFVKLPGQTEGRLDEREAELIDVLPTIADVLGMTLEGPLDGRSLLADAGPAKTRKFIFHSETKKLLIPDLEMRGKFRAARRRRAYFGSKPTPDTLFHIGPGRDELLGRALPQLTIGEGGGRAAEIDDAHRLARIQPHEDVLPGRVTGRLLPAEGGAAPARSELALAVDGVVRALTLTRVEPATAGRFSFLLPEAVLGEGRHTVELFAVAGEEGAWVLEPVEVAPAVVYQLEGERIVSSDGQSYEIRPGAFEGEVFDFLYRNRGFRVEFLGWAEEVPRGAPAETVVVFAGGEFAHAGRTNLAGHPGRHRYQLEGHDESAFVYFLPSDLLRGRVRFFALSSGGAAGELRYDPEMRPREHISF